MTREHAILAPLAAIAFAVTLGVGFSTGFFRADPPRAADAASVATATLKDAPSLVTKAQEHLGRGENKDAIVFLRAATRLNPKDYAAQKLLAAAAFRDNDMVLAANACEAATRLNGEDGDARLGLAKALFVLNRLPDAAAACRAVIDLPSGVFEQRQAARKILERIPAPEQKRPPDITFPITSAY